jgi:hypothetical protein
VVLGENDLRTTLRQALEAVGHPAAALTLVANQARSNPALDEAIASAMRQATWRRLVREELCGEAGPPH